MENPIQAEQQVGSKFVQPRSEQLLALLHWASMLICDGAIDGARQLRRRSMHTAIRIGGR